MKQSTRKGALTKGLRRGQIPFDRIVISVLLVLLVIIPFIVKEPFYMHIFIMIFLFGYLGTAWGLVGQSGQLSFGHAAFVGLGAYTSTILFLNLGVSPWLGMFVGAMTATIAGVIIGPLPSALSCRYM
jgi:branched-chain amino acid transport system permease protein